MRRKTWLVPLGFLALSLAVLLAVYVRGTRAGTERRIPVAGDEGPICYVYADEAGRKEARCAIRLPAELEEVWQAITDYEHFGDLCSCIHAEQIVHEPDGRCRLQARAVSVGPGQLPFAVEMRHEQKLQQYVSSWDQPSGSIEVNRGSWILTPLGPRETLLEVSLEVQVRFVPTFLLRHQSLGRLRDAALGVARRLREGPSGKSW